MWSATAVARFVASHHPTSAEGYLGTSAEYLENVVAGLDEPGIRGTKLLDRHRRVTTLREG